MERQQSHSNLILIGLFSLSLYAVLSRRNSNPVSEESKTESKQREESLLPSETKALSLSKAEVLKLREEYFCNSQVVSYKNTNPLLMIRGEGQYIYDDENQKYLDTRNNVGHIGWQHPEVSLSYSLVHARSLSTLFLTLCLNHVFG